MIDALSFVILLLLATGLSHIVFPYDARNRLFWISTAGMLLLFMIHPLALGFALACYALSTAIFVTGRLSSNERLKARLPYSILLLLFIPDIARLSLEHPVLWLGSAFFIIRQMMTVAQGIKQSASLADFFPALLMSTFCVGALPSGPVFNGLHTWSRLQQNEAPDYSEGCYRVFEGGVYLFAISGFLGLVLQVVGTGEFNALANGNSGQALILRYLIEPLAAFAFLFATFYGYSRIAEGSALLFGFEVPQNFNKPHLAHDLGDFWKRWHRSMADFVMQYIYLPLLVTTTRAKLALIAAFVFMGLWHNFTPGFLIWGLGHGVGLAFILPWAHKRGINRTVIRIASLVYVVILSGIAHGVWVQ
jgi:hypothetical protein